MQPLPPRPPPPGPPVVLLTGDREPMLLLDTTGSMNFATSMTNKTKRLDTVREALKLLVPRLGEHDSAAGEEEDGGGLRTVTFADGKAQDIGDLSPSNLDEKFAAIRWYGGTYLSARPRSLARSAASRRAVPGLNKIVEVFEEEFGESAAEPPLVMLCVITDGEAADTNAFARALITLPENFYVAIGVVGFGEEHNKAVRAFQAVSASQPRCKLVKMEEGSTAAVLASTLEAMFAEPITSYGWVSVS